MARPPVRRVAVVGGGVAGLALAAALPPAVEVIVHEAEPHRAGWGSSLVLWPSAQRALARVGALDALRAGTPVGAGRVFDLAGAPLTPAHDAGLLAVPRPHLLRALAALAGPRLRTAPGAVTDPATLDADLVVGADGVRSRVRALVDPRAADRLPTPYVALRGTTETAPERSRVGEYWGPGVLLGLVPAGSGGSWFTAHRSAAGPEPLDPATVLDEARVLLGAAAPSVRAALDGPGDGVSATRIWVAPPMRRYVRGRYAVLGDAAHAMTPNLGRGACDAVLDAVSLARAIREDRPLAAWQARRHPVTQAARAASAGVMRLAVLDRGHGLRDRVLGLSRAGAGRPPGTR